MCVNVTFNLSFASVHSLLSHPSSVRLIWCMFSLCAHYSSLLSHCFQCHLYWTCVWTDRRSVFLPYWLPWPGRLFSSLSPSRPCLAELVMEPIEWSTVGPIDPQGRTAGYWWMVVQCWPSLLPSSSPAALSASCIFSPLYPPLLNLSLTSFHLPPPSSPSTSPPSSACESRHSSFPLSLPASSPAAIAHRCCRDRCGG